MEHDELVARLAALEARHEEAREWVRGELMSVMENGNVTSAEVVRIDSILRGSNGSDGLCARVRSLERVRATARWAIGIAVAGGISAIWSWLTKT